MALTKPAPFERGLTSVLTSSPDAIGRVPRSFAFKYDVLPLSVEDGALVIAMPNVDDAQIIDQLRNATRMRLRPIHLPREVIRERLLIAYGTDSSSNAIERRGQDAPAVRAVDQILHDAVLSHASDVHVEPTVNGGRVRLRIDGILREVAHFSSDVFTPFSSRLKLLAGMDISDKRQAQDGRYTISHEHREIDARVSSVPTIDGEKIVIRLLDHHAQAPNLADLGMSHDVLSAYRRFVRAPWGFVVVTGPTGSGKTTTLYASLAELDNATKNICSVEDPIEMRIRGVTQVQVNPRAGVTFPSALRSFMRQDPNVVMVGEMRDAETAAVGISASLAGQLVFTTLHSNDAPRTVERLVELGVQRHSLAAGLSAILAQRLVRRLCDQCRRFEPIPDAIRERLKTDADGWYVAVGCRVCSDVGYVGRRGVYELLAVDDEIREAIASGASSVQIAAIGRLNRYRPMVYDGLEKVFTGETSFDELMRVIAWDF